jgi:hypothetical protein
VKSIVVLLALLMTASSLLADTDRLSEERQREIITNYMFATNQRSWSEAALGAEDGEEPQPLKCGTPAILEFIREYDRLDPRLIAEMGAQIASRPNLPFAYDTPSGNIRIHYDVAGINRVRDASIDRNGNGFPDYVEAVGRIADSVYFYTIDTLGYPRPLDDAACLNGGDDRIDIYLRDLAGLFGLTWPDVPCSTHPDTLTVPGWTEIDNDYAEFEFKRYNDRPLDAVRVTVAHEFFHLVHFSLDATEARSIYEMTAVWMEEEQYDDINDYYTLLPRFFNPFVVFRDTSGMLDTVYYHGLSLQSEDSPMPLRNYSAVVFPIFLSERYGRNMIRHIWLRAGELGKGTHWLEAVNDGVDSASGGQDNLVTALQEFNTWTYFTGPFRQFAPNNVGFSEGAAYPAIPVDHQMLVRKKYPDTTRSFQQRFNPQINGAMYLRIEGLSDIVFKDRWRCDSTVFDTVWVCNDTPCTDSTQQINRICVDSTFQPDSTFDVVFFLDNTPEAWGITTIFEHVNPPDSHEVVYFQDPDGGLQYIQIPDPKQFATITFLFTPTAIDPSIFASNILAVQPVEIFLLDSNVVAGPDPDFVDLGPTFLLPFPNPVVVSGSGEQASDHMTFRFQIPTDSMANPEFARPLYQVDLYTIAGELVRTIQVEVDAEPTDRETGPPTVQYEIDWDLFNDGGQPVASGVYLVYAHLYATSGHSELLAEDRTKIVVIR